MGWDRTGERVVGHYMGTFTYQGVVMSSRVKYGGKIQHQIKLDYALAVFGRLAETILVDNDEIA